MKEEYLRPFLKASEKISTRFFGLPVSKDNMGLEKTLVMDKEVIIALGIKDALSGIVLFGLSQKEAEALASHVLAQQGLPGYTQWDELSQSVLREFGNQVVGYVTKLYGADKDEHGRPKEVFKCDITTPSFIKKEQLVNFKKDCIRFELKNEIASMEVKLHIQKN